MLSWGQQNAVLGKVAFSPQNHLAGCELAQSRALLGKKKDGEKREARGDVIWGK